MKKISKIILLMLILSLVACGKKTSTKTSNTTSKTVSQVLAEADANHGGNVTNPNDNNTKKIVKNVGISGGSSNIKRITNEGASSNVKRQNNGNSNTLQASDIDVDLTRLSSTMVYSEVYNMMNTPESYVGKMVRMNGNFAVYKYPERNYYTCIIKDATACCQQGLEFLWRGNHKFPDDYPKEGAPIIVTGIFDIYYEGDQKYCQLKDAYLTKDRA